MSRPKSKSSSSDVRTNTKTISSVAIDAASLRSRNIRETVESIAIAFILAFLFRTFEAEAFVIPTGSMAPTLQGRHKDVECPRCGYWYQASASSEEDDQVVQWRARMNDPREDHNRIRQEIERQQIVSCTCPMCRYPMSVDPLADPQFENDPEVIQGAKNPSYNGDRILVGKFPYETGEPDRFDVIVFKYPGDAKMNYIKRLIGRPNEEILLQHGDVFVRPIDSEDDDFEIARKPPHKLAAMWQIVHDNNHVPADLIKNGWPLRWSVWQSETGGPGESEPSGNWKTQVDTESQINVRQSFEIDGDSSKSQWIRYQHFVPTARNWAVIRQRPLTRNEVMQVRPELITDYYAYNTSRTRYDRKLSQELPGGVPFNRAQAMGLHWVGDLKVDCEIEVLKSQGHLLLDLVEGGRHFESRVDLATGEATLRIEGDSEFAPTGSTDMRSPGNYHVAFANVDDQLLLWVDGDLIEFDRPTTFESGGSLRPMSSAEDAGDLAPAGIGSAGAALRVTNLKLFRDIYYIADNSTARRGPITDYHDRLPPILNLTPENLTNFLSDPQKWDVFEERSSAKFEMYDDQFFVLGDNSPFSKDGRLWGADNLSHYVERKMLIGKALFIYWPHSWSRIPGTSIPFPFFPNFAKMGFVR